ncbi:uncharacterized protein LOC120356206 [Nilaparvata lugens]|uniref:uncharacterized protein LOC120356206 n=1 Tax=Nilaparvata lugens TaxID=108931 RepID=UPI00193D7E81|nr:uncharacterized protein LOC120356206 [Nilaparvata lugens]
MIVKKICIRNGDNLREKDLDGFLELYKADWSRQISNKAILSINEGRYNKGAMLPNSNDMRILGDFLQKEREAAVDNLKREANAQTYKALVKVALASITIFNRKRAGDAHSVTIDYYVNKTREPPHQGVLDCLTEDEKSLLTKFTRLESRGKQESKIPILLPETMVEMIDLMISLRNICGVKPENKFLFAVPGTPNSYYRCSDVIREMRNRAGTKYTERITQPPCVKSSHSRSCLWLNERTSRRAG